MEAATIAGLKIGALIVIGFWIVVALFCLFLLLFY